MRQDIELTSFTKGEVSPRLKGRTDYKGYFDACETLLNMVVLPQGGATRRPGTIYVSQTKNMAVRGYLVPFQFKTTQAYMLEFGAGFIRVYRNGGAVTNVLAVTGAANNGAGLIRLQVASTAGLYTGNTAAVAAVGGVPNATGTWLVTVIDATHFDLQGSTFAGAYTTGGTATVLVEIPTNYVAADLQALAFTQSADTLYIWSPVHPAATLTRSSHTNWTLADIFFLDGPYLETNTTATTLTGSATTGSITVTASATTGINSNTGFQTTDVNRIIRMKVGANWSWLLITARASTTSVTATVMAAVNNGAAGALDATTATATWRLGKWSVTTGYPWLPSFWQQRLVSVGTDNQPNAIEASQTGDFTNFAPTKADGSVVDTNALSWIISDDQVNAFRWISPAGSAQAMQLGLGTDGSEHILQAATTAQALTPTSVQAYRETTLGAVAYANALRIGKAVLFANAAGRKIHRWQFNWQVNGYEGPDLTVDSEHITLSGIVDMVYQKNPYGVVWFILGDGMLGGMTYLPEQNVTAFHRHRLGGSWYGADPIVEAIATIPSPDGTYDQLWMIVKRRINGATTRYIELMSPFFDQTPQEQAIFMDAALSSSLLAGTGTLTIAAVSGNGVIFSSSSAEFLPDTQFTLRVNGGYGFATTGTATHGVIDWGTPALSLEPAPPGTWTTSPQQTAFSGLSHLEGETVHILGDGADFGTATVTGGVATLPEGSASYATIGLPTAFQLTGMPFEPLRAAAASTQGKVKTIATLFLRLLETLGCNIGRKITDPMTQAVSHPSEPLETRSAADKIGLPPPLFSGILRLPAPGSHDLEGQLEISGSGPYPCTILSLNAIGDVGEMPGPG